MAEGMEGKRRVREPSGLRTAVLVTWKKWQEETPGYLRCKLGTGQQGRTDQARPSGASRRAQRAHQAEPQSSTAAGPPSLLH